MAEAQAGNAESEGGGGKSSLMLYIIFAVVLLVAVGGSVGATLFLMGGSGAVETEPEQAPGDVEDEGRLAPAVYHQIRPPFIINFMVGDKSRYLQADVTLMMRDPTILDAVSLHTPLIRDAIIDTLSTQDYLFLQTEDGKVALQEELQRRVRELLSRETGRPGIEQVFITNFVMQ